MEGEINNLYDQINNFYEQIKNFINSKQLKQTTKEQYLEETKDIFEKFEKIINEYWNLEELFDEQKEYIKNIYNIFISKLDSRWLEQYKEKLTYFKKFF